MKAILQKIRTEFGYSLVETITLTAVLFIVISSLYALLEVNQTAERRAEEGFQAQDEGREILTELAKYLRPAQKLNVSGFPYAFADPKGNLIDLKLDVNDDGNQEIVRFALNRDNQKVEMLIDSLDANGKYKFEAAGQSYAAYYTFTDTASDPAKWDQVKTLATKVVNEPPSGSNWNNQDSNTNINPDNHDGRLFTFYGETFVYSLDSSAATWMNSIRGIKIYIETDIRPADIPSPYIVTSNVNLRNVSRE